MNIKGEDKANSHQKIFDMQILILKSSNINGIRQRGTKFLHTGPRIRQPINGKMGNFLQLIVTMQFHNEHEKRALPIAIKIGVETNIVLELEAMLTESQPLKYYENYFADKDGNSHQQIDDEQEIGNQFFTSVIKNYYHTIIASL